jgi:hypothetical protein
MRTLAIVLVVALLSVAADAAGQPASFEAASG